MNQADEPRPEPGALPLAGADIDVGIPPPAGGEPSPGKDGLLGRGASVSFVLQSAGVAIRYLSQALLARWMGAAAFGAYTYASNFSQLLATPANLGGANSGLRFVPEYLAKDRPQLVEGVLRAFRLVPLVLGTVVAAVAASVVVLAGPGPASVSVMLLALAACPFFALVDVQTVLARGFGSLFWALLPGLVLLPLLIALGVAAVFAVDGRPSAGQATLVTTLAVVVVSAVQALVLRRVPGRKRRDVEPAYEPRAWVRVSMPLFFVSSLNLVFQRVDVLLVGLFLGAREAGVYAVAFRTAALASILQTAMNTTVAPRISKLFWSDRRDELEATVLRAIRLIILPSLVLTVVLVVFGGPLLSLFGDSFRDGRSALAVYAVGQLVSVSNGPVGWLMNLTGHQTQSAIVNGVSAGACLVGYLVLIPTLGIVGAAAANAGAVVLKNVWSNAVVRRRLGFRISLLRAATAPRHGHLPGGKA